MRSFHSADPTFGRVRWENHLTGKLRVTLWLDGQTGLGFGRSSGDDGEDTFDGNCNVLNML